jgi:hypothetical protein
LLITLFSAKDTIIPKTKNNKFLLPKTFSMYVDVFESSLVPKETTITITDTINIDASNDMYFVGTNIIHKANTT